MKKIAGLKKVVFQFLIDAVDADGYDETPETSKEKIDFVYRQFRSAAWFDHNIRKFGGNEVNMFADWLMGLPGVLNIPFYNSDILELARTWGTLAPGASEKKEDKILENYWNYIAVHFFQLKERLERDAPTVVEFV